MTAEAAASDMAASATAADVAWAGMWGLISAVSLMFGAVLALFVQPTKVQNSVMMAFGGGALIEALAIELFGHIILWRA